MCRAASEQLSASPFPTPPARLSCLPFDIAGAHHADVLTKLEGFVGTDAWDNESAVALKAVRDDPLVKAVDVDTLSKVSFLQLRC